MTDSPSELIRLSATSIASGDILGGKYRVDKQLGAGGMGVVLLATHLELDAQVAIKVVRDEFARNEEVVARMLFEARAVAKLKSSHVVRVLDVARLESGAPYIVMERLEGWDLAKVLTENGGPLNVQEVVDYVLQACEGLVEAHGLGIVHRDLKPENLFRANTREGHVVKVLDFGISKETGISPGISPRSVMTSAGYAVGSPYYMSPEQMRAQEVDARADIWSLGAILYELLSGRCPFEGESLPVVCASVLSETEAVPLSTLSSQVPEELSAIVMRCLRKDREQRFASVVELTSALRVFASAEGQRSADRSSRPAFGSDFRLKSDRPTATPPPMAASTGVTAASFRPASRKYLPIAAAVLILAAVGVAWSALRAPSVAPEGPKSVLPAAQPVVATSLAPAPEAAAPPTIAPTPAAAPSTETKAQAGSKRRGVAAPVVAPAAPASAAKAAAPAPVSPKAPADAWDPDRLGGRY